MSASEAIPSKSLYMVVERFKDAPAVYRRFRDQGRMMPEGLSYLSSWVDDKFERCYQLMETHDRRELCKSTYAQEMNRSCGPEAVRHLETPRILR